MTPGDPYFTKELDERRSRQRSLVPVIQRLLDNVEVDVIELPSDLAAGPETEVALRAVAQQILDRHTAYLESECLARQVGIAVGLTRRLSAERGWADSASMRFNNHWSTLIPSPPNEDEALDWQRKQDLGEALLFLVVAERISLSVV